MDAAVLDDVLEPRAALDAACEHAAHAELAPQLLRWVNAPRVVRDRVGHDLGVEERPQVASESPMRVVIVGRGHALKRGRLRVRHGGELAGRELDHRLFPGGRIRNRAYRVLGRHRAEDVLTVKGVELLRRILAGDAVDEGAPAGMEARELRDVVDRIVDYDPVVIGGRVLRHLRAGVRRRHRRPRKWGGIGRQVAPDCYFP